jgi:hypothetical protein
MEVDNAYWGIKILSGGIAQHDVCAALPSVAWASPHFHLRCATVKTSHTPGTLDESAPRNREKGREKDRMPTGCYES